MYSERRHITTLVTRWLLCLWGVIGLAACSADSEPEEDSVGDVLQLSADTRAGNLVTIEGAGAEGSSIYIFTAIANTTATQKHGTAVMTDDKWHSSIRVKKEQQYYLYGFMPVDVTDNPSIGKVDAGTDYDQSAVITLPNVDAICPHDLCVLIGVQDCNSATDAKNVKVGKFSYVGKERGQNYVHLLFRHVYASVVVKLKVDADYDKLRTIVLREMKLTSTSGKNKYDITMAITANNTEADPAEVTMTPVESIANTPTFTLYKDVDGDAEDGLTLTTTAVEFPAFFAPQTWSGMTLVTTYDVYDKEGRLVRPNCTVENKLTTPLSAQTLAAGEKLTITATIKPTYLYLLSEYDVDNSGITLN